MNSNPVTRARLPIFSGLEREVIRLGIRDGEQARRGSIVQGLLTLAARPTGQALSGQALANPSLEALRAWTEMACALLPSGRGAPTAALTKAGYSPAQIAEVQRLVTAVARTDEGGAA